MTKLNCSVGDLAITVSCKLPENLGDIVRIKSAIGMQEWGDAENPMFSWEVEIATEHGWLVYQYEDHFEKAKSGPAPDKYLRRITPPKGYLMEEFADSKQMQMCFHELDLTEAESNV